MRTMLMAAAATMLLAGGALASEEDYGAITRVELTARTTSNTFGVVVVRADTAEVPGGFKLSALSVKAKGKTWNVPKQELAKIAAAVFLSARISSEVGYPQSGIGPYLYLSFSGSDGTADCRFKLTFDSSGFKELAKAKA